MEIKTPLSIWIQCASFCFLSAGVFSDLLLIRICLVFAYLFLLLNGLLGSPLWGSLYSPNQISLDTVLWAIANLYVHMTSAIRLILDERRVVLTEEEEALWRVFYRTGGVSKKVFFNTVGQHMKTVYYKNNERIPVSTHFNIIYKGSVRVNVSHRGQILSSLRQRSGYMFNVKDLGLLHNEAQLEKREVTAESKSDLTCVFQFPIEKIREISHLKQTRNVWQAMMMESLDRIAQRFFDNEEDVEKAKIEKSDEYVLPLFFPLQEWEEPFYLQAGSGKTLNNFFRHIGFSAIKAFSPPWGFHPTGIRHATLPAPSLTMSQLKTNAGSSVWVKMKSFVRRLSSRLTFEESEESKVVSEMALETFEADDIQSKITVVKKSNSLLSRSSLQKSIINDRVAVVKSKYDHDKRFEV